MPIPAWACQDIRDQWTVSHAMNHRESPSPSGAGCRALPWLLLLLLPVLTPAGPTVPPHHFAPFGRRGAGLAMTPYLPIVGAPLLRIQDEKSASHPVARVPSPAPPIPSRRTSDSPTPLPERPSSEPAARAPSPKPVAVPESGPRSPAPILHDEIRPAVRPEDFLPYFLFPGSATRGAGEIKVVVPAATPPTAPAGSMPASSATYSKTPE